MPAAIPPVPLVCVGFETPKGIGAQNKEYPGPEVDEGEKVSPRLKALFVFVQMACVTLGTTEGMGTTLTVQIPVFVTTTLKAFVPVT